MDGTTLRTPDRAANHEHFGAGLCQWQGRQLSESQDQRRTVPLLHLALLPIASCRVTPEAGTFNLWRLGYALAIFLEKREIGQKQLGGYGGSDVGYASQINWGRNGRLVPTAYQSII